MKPKNKYMASKKPKTKKVTHASWNALDAGTRKRALQFVLGPHFREWMVADSLNKDYIFWPVIELKVRIVTEPNYPYKVCINSSTFTN